VRDVVLSYYALLRMILWEAPELRRCLCHCRHCGIFFITHPRNAKRTDLGCPFGCQESYRKQRSSERSAAYYRTSEGRVKKRLQNERRRRTGLVTQLGAHGEGKGMVGGTEKPRLSTEGKRLGIAVYLAMVISFIERRRVGEWEIQRLLERIMRQHSIAHRLGMDYVVGEQQKSPP
jgi:hypothetical protein